MTFAFNKVIQDSNIHITGGFNICIKSLPKLKVMVENFFNKIASQQVETSNMFIRIYLQI